MLMAAHFKRCSDCGKDKTTCFKKNKRFEWRCFYYDDFSLFANEHLLKTFLYKTCEI